MTFNTARNILAIKFYGTEEGKEINRILNQVDENPWYTGIPTENGLYAVYYYADNEYDYGFADWNGKCWEEHFSFDDVGCRIIAWIPIDPYKEKEDGR